MVKHPRSSEDAQCTPEATSALFGVLADGRRRYTLRCLREHANPMALADLADEVAAWENETTLAEVPAEEVKHIYLSLYHRHVPKLADNGLVRYDQEQDSVVLLERADRLERNHDLSIGE